MPTSSFYQTVTQPISYIYVLNEFLSEHNCAHFLLMALVITNIFVWGSYSYHRNLKKNNQAKITSKINLNLCTFLMWYKLILKYNINFKEKERNKKHQPGQICFKAQNISILSNEWLFMGRYMYQSLGQKLWYKSRWGPPPCPLQQIHT